MIATILVLSAAAAMQPTDATRSAREAYTACLRGFVDRSLDARMSAADFGTAFPRQCTTQEAAFRAAVIRRETASRMSRADSEQAATDEIEEAQTNFRERFEMSMPASAAPAPQPAAAAAPAPEAAPTATASATPQ